MRIISYLIFFAGSVFAESENSFVSKFYEDTYSHEYSCSAAFHKRKHFDCACITGMWILYDSCSDKVIVSSDDTPRCQKLTGAPIAKAVKVVSNLDELATVSPKGVITLMEPEVPVEHLEIDKEWALIAGSDWTLLDAEGTRVCLSVVEKDAYCIFASTDDESLKIIGVEKGCKQFDYFLDPKKCFPNIGEYENICEPQVNHKKGKRQAEEEPAAAQAPPAGPDSTPADQSESTSTEITEDDEDYAIFQRISSRAENETDPTDIIADGILEYVDSVLDDILGLRDDRKENDLTESEAGFDKRKRDAPSDFGDYDESTNSSDSNNPLNVTFSNPVYEFLEISKRIMQKTCPPFYVRPEFLNLAVATFIHLQQVQFKFPESSFKPVSFRRVLQALRNCEEEATQFNFTDADCDGRVDGNYSAYDKTIELTISTEYANFDKDPMVESVWKIFFNAHSYCYSHFENRLDHHRFTSWMTPLFQNQINDIWTAGKTTEKSLNGLFGNQMQVQANLAYCAASSRLDSEYPFDIPRPSKVADYSSGLDNGTASESDTDSPGRKRRDIHSIKPFTVIQHGGCMNRSEPLLCEDHVQSFAK